jgi:hypothetical protein
MFTVTGEVTGQSPMKDLHRELKVQDTLLDVLVGLVTLVTGKRSAVESMIIAKARGPNKVKDGGTHDAAFSKPKRAKVSVNPNDPLDGYFGHVYSDTSGFIPIPDPYDAPVDDVPVGNGLPAESFGMSPFGPPAINSPSLSISGGTWVGCSVSPNIHIQVM